MTDSFIMSIRQNTAERKLGFKIERSYVSPIGLVVERRFKGIEDLIRLSAFTLFLERRHVDSGMPECCVDAKNIRRLGILLHRNKNVKHIVILENQEDRPLKHTIKNIQDLVSGTIEDEKFEYLWTRGRFERYGFKKGELKSVFANVTGLEVRLCSANSLPKVVEELTKKMGQYITELKEIAPPPVHRKSFFVLPSSLDDYIIPILAQNLTPNDVLHANDVKRLFGLCEQILYKFGCEVRDYRDVGRWQLGQELMLKLDICRNEKDLEWRKTLESFLAEIETYLGKIGIGNSRSAYETSEFFERLFEDKERRRIRHEDFVERISDDIKNERLGDSNALIILVERDDLSSEKKSKIGWSGIRCYMRPQKDHILLSLSHDLRSIDLYDGFPVNLFFCLEYSLKFMRDLMKRLPHEIQPKVRLDNLKFIIHYLHAYLDDVPANLVREA